MPPATPQPSSRDVSSSPSRRSRIVFVRNTLYSARPSSDVKGSIADWNDEYLNRKRFSLRSRSKGQSFLSTLHKEPKAVTASSGGSGSDPDPGLGSSPVHIPASEVPAESGILDEGQRASTRLLQLGTSPPVSLQTADVTAREHSASPNTTFGDRTSQDLPPASPMVLVPTRETKNFRSRLGGTTLFNASGDMAIDYPPSDYSARTGDLFIFKYPNGVRQWVRTADKVWVIAEQGMRHPALADRLLWLKDDLEPSWVVRTTYYKYESIARKKASLKL
ncbi:hypothetical protein EIP86_011095 [Pleurotus ostreatoroseus]|nr:hypothetical protein EIP86_011095 [Pleurotus ostreatoroseus]